MRRLLLYPAVLGLFLTGCATTQNEFLEPVGIPESNRFFYRGHSVVTDVVDGILIAGYATRTMNEVRLTVYVKNNSPERVDIGPEDFVVERISGYSAESSDDSSGDEAQPMSLAVYRRSEYLEKLRQDRNAALVGAALGGMAASFSAGYQTSSTTGTYTGVTPSGDTVMGSYSETTSGYDPAAAAQAQANTQNTVNSIEQHYTEQVSIWSQVLLGRTTLMPGQEITGKVIAKDQHYAADEYRVTLSLHGDNHALTLVPEE